MRPAASATAVCCVCARSRQPESAIRFRTRRKFSSWPAKYKVTPCRSPEDQEAARETVHVDGLQVQLGENNLDFDLQKEAQNAAKGQGLTPEQLKQMQEQQAKAQKETNSVKSLNEKLNAAKTAADGGDYDTAIADLNEATQVDASRDLLWFKLADYYRLSAVKQTDPAEKQ